MRCVLLLAGASPALWGSLAPVSRLRPRWPPVGRPFAERRGWQVETPLCFSELPTTPLPQPLNAFIAVRGLLRGRLQTFDASPKWRRPGGVFLAEWENVEITVARAPHYGPNLRKA